MAFRASVGRYFKNFKVAPVVVECIYVTNEAVAILEYKYYTPEPLCYLRSVQPAMTPPPPPPPTCKRCGREGHVPRHCIAKYDVGGEEIDSL